MLREDTSRDWRDAATSHGTLEPPGAGRARTILPESRWGGCDSADSILTSGLQDCEKIHIFVFFYFKRCWFGGLNFFSELIEITLLSLPIHAR